MAITVSATPLLSNLWNVSTLVLVSLMTLLLDGVMYFSTPSTISPFRISHASATLMPPTPSTLRAYDSPALSSGGLQLHR